MSRVTVSFPQGDPRRRIAAMQIAARQGCHNAVTEAVIATKTLAQTTMTDIDAVDQGIARASMDYLIQDTPTGTNGITFCGADHGRWIEFGRAGIQKDPTNSPYAAKAAFPPVAVLIPWVQRHYKALAPSGRTPSGRARRPRFTDVKTVAFLIARAIYLRGIKPRPFLVPAFNRIAKLFPSRVQYHVLKMLAKVK